MDNRHSTYSNLSTFSTSRSTAQQSAQVSTTTLLNNLHNAYLSGQPCSLDASTTLVVNTWLNAAENGGTTIVDSEIATRAWEHARRRAEDGTIALYSLHQSTPSCLVPFISTLPFTVPNSLYTTLSILKPFTCHVTPFNASYARYSALAVSFHLSLAGSVTGAAIRLSTSGIDSANGLLNIPAESGYRVFDVFYNLLISASTASEREFLGLKDPAAYSLLNRSQTYNPPQYLPAADDAGAGEDLRNALKLIGIKGAAHRNFLSVLAGLLKLGDTLNLLINEDELDDIFEDVAGLLGVEPEAIAQKCSAADRSILIAGLYESLVDWIIAKCNEAIRLEVQNTKEELSNDGSRVMTPNTEDEDSVTLTIVEIPGQDLGKAIALRTVFDDSNGINAEMKEDGVAIVPAGSSVLKEMANAVTLVSAHLAGTTGIQSQERDLELDRRQGILERIGVETEDGAFLRTILYPVQGEGILVGKHNRFELAHLFESSRVWHHLSIHPTDEAPAKLSSLSNSSSIWSAGSVSRQLRAWRLPEWANRRNKNIDFTADFDIEEFATRYSRLGCMPGRDGVESWLLQKGWSNGEAVLGQERVWIREGAWWEAESMLDLKPEQVPQDPFATPIAETGYGMNAPGNGSGFFPPFADNPASRESLLQPPNYGDAEKRMTMGARSTMAPTIARTVNTMAGDYGLGAKGDDRRDYEHEFDGEFDAELGEPKNVTSEPVTLTRRLWTIFVWALTFWIPSFVLRYVGRMKRPDVRMAWREKLTLIFIIFFLNAVVVFYIIFFGNLLCPNFDKAWNPDEVAQHQGDNDFFVSFHGGVYDISKFWEINHSDVPGQIADKTTMQPFGGQNVDNMFTAPLTLLCPNFVKSDTITLMFNNTPIGADFPHVSGSRAVDRQSKLGNANWWNQDFLPKMQEYYKGDLVYTYSNFSTQGVSNGRQWVMLNSKIYDFTDYFHTLKIQSNRPEYNWLPSDIVSLIQSNPGQDITSQWGKSTNYTESLACFDNVFAAGFSDYRYSARCQVNNYILLGFTVIICAVIGIKFISALQFGSKRRPSPQDKFVICQVPAYTEGEDQLRKGLDSLTALQYDNKRKLIFVICDGMIVGGGNDRPTPKIVLDILGVDPKIDPPALPFKSIGQGSEQLNYGKVYSGLYEFEGNVVPYIVVVKVGKESEQTKSKPGNRGKRDSQILLMRFLNRVHHRSPMSPLELEMFHQINNVIGVDPELYEYLFMVDADTSVREDSLNRLVSACANDSKIAGICGETSLQNEERSLWTMIQVYEYYISHHLAKAFESLFGSVTCLPGCFCMYRLRTADKGRPLIIHDKLVEEYSDGNVDTLHKKNLLSLGEDRYLTTLMTKHFPQMSYKFIPDAYAATAAPETWSVLLSQRRRWINSTIHNLGELVFLKDLCGFCCFSMRFVVMLDLFGTLILPATCTYLGYLIYRIATHSGPFPLVSVILLGAVYGLQALIFILKRQWQHVGWMIIYLIAFPIYSFLLPIYSFWKQDDFSWGNTRVVIGEKGNKQIVATTDEGFDPRSIPLQRWDDYALQNNLPGRRGGANMEKPYDAPYTDNVYEMDEMRSMYSSARPASTILTGFQNNGLAHIPPQHSRHATMTSFAKFGDQPQYQQRTSPRHGTPDPYRDNGSNYGRNTPMVQSQENMIGLHSAGLRSSRSQLNMSRPVSGMDFRTNQNGLDDMAITEAVRSCLAEVDLDSVTKKQGQ
jgi:chitin synthase